MRLHKALINSGKVRAAQSTISNSYEGIKNQLTTLSTVIAKARYEFLLLPISITIAIRVNVHCGAALIGVGVVAFTLHRLHSDILHLNCWSLYFQITAGDSAESTLTVTKPT